jgi:hypothetical protein
LGAKLQEEVNVVRSFGEIFELYDIFMRDCFPCVYFVLESSYKILFGQGLVFAGIDLID